MCGCPVLSCPALPCPARAYVHCSHPSMRPGLSQPAKPDRQVGILATSKARGRCGINTSALSRRLSWITQFTSIHPSSLACSLASLNRRSTISKRRASTTVCLVSLLCSLSVRTIVSHSPIHPSHSSIHPHLPCLRFPPTTHIEEDGCTGGQTLYDISLSWFAVLAAPDGFATYVRRARVHVADSRRSHALFLPTYLLTYLLSYHRFCPSAFSMVVLACSLAPDTILPRREERAEVCMHARIKADPIKTIARAPLLAHQCSYTAEKKKKILSEKYGKFPQFALIPSSSSWLS
ncbi:hypothetical protein IWZ03DRAFT_205209 [Phyllosticta citriasiana]|uniref:Uncharacterized protein n=1 Tax=Phyllosticta citriasiana TaxID=595635 RepID=A0ABR1KK75_9PEZI